MTKHKGPFEFERHEIAKSLFDAIKGAGGEEWVAVRIRGETLWEVAKPRHRDMMRRALATYGSELEDVKEELRAVGRELMAAGLIDDTALDGIDIALDPLP